MHYLSDKSLLPHGMSSEHRHTCNMYQKLTPNQVDICHLPKLSSYSCEVEDIELRGVLGHLIKSVKFNFIIQVAILICFYKPDLSFILELTANVSFQFQ